ncbi:hypothetical protein HBI24_165660 [Parastagonospora nodorum]|nr:hypothetical protein HBH43_094440 [Parastagonospora nodorum]KAH4295628.1 hypothetical protein HBI01_154250 [Parastagonospora nodorum]KAH4297882.1 hypothetical protein HBI02_158710 [Parastagonospora nodorum]KAH4326375.1 hypothetical protein HBI00_145130 [Parastagonospora nodorum]KAH4364532.1 hypothetical protein HBH94_164670 [Parastagonospora nodorum]
MDGAASIIAVVSLTLQLEQTVNTVKTFVRDVKGASKELERLIELLELLGALLQDVRDVMERQTSLRDFPLPSNTIFACLKSCEKSLGLLEDEVTKHRKVQGSNPSAMKRLKDDVKLAFRAKDIVAFEARIQRDINHLHTSLGTNTTKILNSVLPIILLNQNTMISSSISHIQNHIRIPANNVDTTQTMSVSLSRPHHNIKTRHKWIESPLNRFGIRRRRTTKFIRTDPAQNKCSKQETDTIISEYYETFMSSNFLGFACHLSRRHPYGNILPSLRVHPVVDIFYKRTALIETGTIEEIQRAFATGTLHPFTTDKYGNTLLDRAVQATRPDVYRLLQEYGVKPAFGCHTLSELRACFMGLHGSNDNSRDIDTLRLLLPNVDPTGRKPGLPVFLYLSYRSLDAAAWLWVNAVFHLYGPELTALRIFLAQTLVSYYSFPDIELHGRVSELLVELMDVEMIELYGAGGYVLLPDLFTLGYSSVDSEYVGRIFSRLLTRLGMDVETCIRQEIDNFPRYILFPHGLSPRRLIFERHQDETSILRWEWDCDTLSIGYLVVNEFSALANCADFWPFVTGSGRIARATQVARYERRAATKVRKERAQMGQKRVRSRMPGAWI